MFGISLLTFVPGELGGTETYARELTRAIVAGGELEYRVFVPPLAGVPPGEVVPEYRAGRSMPRRFAAMGLAAAHPGPIRRRLETAEALHYPLTIALPEVGARMRSRCTTSSTTTCRSREPNGSSGSPPTTVPYGARRS